MAAFFAPNYIPARFHDRAGTRPMTKEERGIEALGRGCEVADLPEDLHVRFSYASIRAVHDYVLGLSQGDLFRLEDGTVSDAPTCMSQYGLCE